MGLWTDIATYVGPTPNTSGSVVDHMYVVIHTADSGSAGVSGIISWQKNPDAQVSSHFIVAKDGGIFQMLDTAQKSWAQIDGNPYSISVENEGNENTPLTDAQLRANARILVKAHQVYGIPLQLTGQVGVRGLGHHSMGFESGVNWGHEGCPGEIIKGQKQAILNYALGVGGFLMALTDEQQNDLWAWLASMMDPNTPTSGRTDDRFHFPPPFVGVNHKLDDLKTAVANGTGAAPSQDQVNAAVAKAMQDPNVLKAFAKAINDDAAARLAQ